MPVFPWLRPNKVRYAAGMFGDYSVNQRGAAQSDVLASSGHVLAGVDERAQTAVSEMAQKAVTQLPPGHERYIHVTRGTRSTRRKRDRFKSPNRLTSWVADSEHHCWVLAGPGESGAAWSPNVVLLLDDGTIGRFYEGPLLRRSAPRRAMAGLIEFVSPHALQPEGLDLLRQPDESCLQDALHRLLNRAIKRYARGDR